MGPAATRGSVVASHEASAALLQELIYLDNMGSIPLWHKLLYDSF